jgi:hypothetical protein
VGTLVGRGLSYCLANLQLEHLLFAKPDTEQVARLIQDAKEKTDFFIDALWSGAFIEASVLVLNDSRLVKSTSILLPTSRFI